MSKQQSNPADNPEEQLSAAFDGEFSGPLSLSEGRQTELKQDWRLLRSELQALPVESVDLVSAVRGQLDPPAQPDVRNRQSRAVSRRAPMTVWSVTAAVAVVAVLAVVPLLDGIGFSDQSSDNVTILRKHFDRIVPDPASCRVVVVNVAAETSVAETVREVLGAVERRGVAATAMHTAIDEGAEYSAGFLLAAGSESLAILDALADDSQQLEWNPADVGGRSPDEIKEMFLASVKVPTESDKVFGAMYVVNEDSLVVSLEELPAAVEDPMSAIASSVAEDEGLNRPLLSEIGSDVTVEKSSDSAPLIVIFCRQNSRSDKPSAPEQNESRTGSIPQSTA